MPAVLSLHGGPEAQERPGWSAEYQALLAEGIAVFAPNVRGSSGFGTRFASLDDGPLRAGAIRDVKSAADHLVAAGVADPARIGAMGGSYGGYLTLCAVTEFPDRFRAAVDLYGIVNFETFFARTEPWMAQISKHEYGDPDTQRDLLRALSPIHEIGRIRAATLVVHGARDTNVPVEEAEQVVERLRRGNVPVDFLLFPDEGHGIQKTANQRTLTLAVARWFRRYL